MRQHRPWQAQLTLDMLASVSRNRLPRPASRHSRSVRIQTQEGSVCPPCLPRSPADALTCCAATTLTCTASSVRFAWECIVGRREGGLVDGRPGREHELDTPQLELGSVRTHTQSPSKADLTVHMRAEADTQQQPTAVALHPITAVRPQDRARNQSPLPSDHHHRHYQRSRLSLVDCTVALRPIQPRV